MKTTTEFKLSAKQGTSDAIYDIANGWIDPDGHSEESINCQLNMAVHTSKQYRDAYVAVVLSQQSK